MNREKGRLRSTKAAKEKEMINISQSNLQLTLLTGFKIYVQNYAR